MIIPIRGNERLSLSKTNSGTPSIHIVLAAAPATGVVLLSVEIPDGWEVTREDRASRSTSHSNHPAPLLPDGSCPTGC